MNKWLRMIPIALLAIAVGACGPDDEDNNGNNGGNNGGMDAGDTSMDTGMDTMEDDTVEADTTQDTGEEDTDPGVEPSIIASDQTADPTDEVTVDEVTSDGDGWVVIHEENDAGDSFGAVIGQTAVPDGTSMDIGVTLDRAVEDGETLYAMLHVDDPADGNYNFDPTADEPDDPPATDADGMIVVVPFTVTLPGAADPSVTVSDQAPIPSNEVVVDEVVAADAGWMVIHEENDAGDSFGAVIGHAEVSDGINEDVMVSLDRDIVDGETLYAMLHVDDPADGDYTFDPDDNAPEDPPVASGGDVVVESFSVFEPGDAPTVTGVDQTLELTTMVNVASAHVIDDGFMVIHEHDPVAGGPGAVIGHGPVDAGAQSDIVVALDRPVEDGEKLHAMLHEDTGSIGDYEFDGSAGSPDPPVTDSNGDIVVDDFEVSVPADTPAVRFTVTNINAASYDFTGAQPQRYEAWIGPQASNETLTLNEGWRYEIVNNAGKTSHPFELIASGAAPVQDDVLASQSDAVDGSMEGDPDVNWTQVDDSVQFTLTSGLAGSADMYRCGIHTASMRGDISTQSP